MRFLSVVVVEAFEVAEAVKVILAVEVVLLGEKIFCSFMGSIDFRLLLEFLTYVPLWY